MKDRRIATRPKLLTPDQIGMVSFIAGMAFMGLIFLLWSAI